MQPEYKPNWNRLEQWLETQERKYNPEKDSPEIQVTMTDMSLIQTCKELIKEVKHLRKEITGLTGLFYILNRELDNARGDCLDTEPNSIPYD